MDQFLTALVSGIASGSVYGLMGLGLVIIFRSTDVVNFALAAMATMAVYVGLSLFETGLPVILALVGAIVFGAVASIGIREVVLRPLGEGRLFAALVTTMGLGIIIEHAVGEIWGTQPRRFPKIIEGSVPIGGYQLQNQDLLIVVTAGIAMTAVAYLFTRTPIGVAMRAAAESQDIARILGVNPQKIARVAWGLGISLGVLGAFLIVPKTGLAPTVLAAALFRAFAGIFLGGLNSMVGAVVGGLTIGVMDNIAAMYISASYRDTFVFAVAVAILLIRPQGMFGRATFERV